MSDRSLERCTRICRNTMYREYEERRLNIPSSVDPATSVQIQVLSSHIDRSSYDRSAPSASRWRHFRYSEAGNLHRCNTQQLHLYSHTAWDSHFYTIVRSVQDGTRMHLHSCSHSWVYVNTACDYQLESFTVAILSGCFLCHVVFNSQINAFHFTVT